MIELFIKIRVIDIVDILLVAVLIYQVYQMIKGTAAINIFFGIIFIYSIYLLVDALQMRLLRQILEQFINVGVIILVVVFQQEIRKFLLLLGNSWRSGRFRIFQKILPRSFVATSGDEINWEELKQGLNDLVGTGTGALIVLMKNSELKYYLKTGVPIEAKLSSQLIDTIFFKNSPLHDGAILVKGPMVKAARCILPITEKSDLPDHLGLRHRAALGITEVSDAIAIAVSEENQKLSISYHGKIELNLTVDELMSRAKKYLSES